MTRGWTQLLEAFPKGISSSVPLAATALCAVCDATFRARYDAHRSVATTFVTRAFSKEERKKISTFFAPPVTIGAAFASEGSLKKQINPNIKAQLLRGALFLLLLLAVCVFAFAWGRRLIGALSLMENPTGFVVCPGGWPAGWRAGPDMPSTGVRMVGVNFAPISKFYVMGGRSMDGVGNDFTHPFEYNPGTNTGRSSRPVILTTR
jgi:hypothetical protein